MQPIVKSLVLHPYRSFVSEQVDFDNPTFFVGRNGAGKSNLVDALAFLSDTMTMPLQSALSQHGGRASFRYRPQLDDERQLGLGVVLEDLGNGVETAHYAFVLHASGGDFAVVREQCVIEQSDGTRRWFDRNPDGYNSNVVGLAPAIQPRSLVMPIVGGDSRFEVVPRALSSVRVCAIEPALLRGPQFANGGVGLQANGANAVAVLEQIQQQAPDDLNEICELLAAIVPGVEQVWPVRSGDRLMMNFLQNWGGVRVGLRAADMSDGTLRAVGMLLAAFQRPRPTLLAVEEPEATIHSGALGVVLDILQHASHFMQVVVMTHSPDLLDAKWIEDRHVRVINWQDGESHIAHLADSSREALRRHLMGAGELLRSNALDATPLVVGTDMARTPLFAEGL